METLLQTFAFIFKLRGRETELDFQIETSDLLVHPPNTSNSWDGARSKPGASRPIQRLPLRGYQGCNHLSRGFFLCGSVR